MAPERELPRRVGRKLTKRRKPERHPFVQYPERLKEGDDVQDDVTAAKGQPAQYVNQSVFSLIAAAGSKVDFHARFDEDSSGSDEDPDPDATIRNHAASALSVDTTHDQHQTGTDEAAQNRLEQSTLEHGPRRSVPKLNLWTIKEKNYMSQSSLPLSSCQTPSAETSKGFTPRDAPVMGKMLEAQAQLCSSTDLSGREQDVPESPIEAGHGQGRTTLVTRLMEIFGFETPEEVIAGQSSIAFVMLFACADCLTRIPLLASAKRSAPGLPIHYPTSSLFLRLFT